MRRRVASWLAGLSLSAAAWPAVAADSPLPLQTLSAGMYRIQVEVADTPATLQRGLMHRTELAEQHGMLFLFPYSGRQCMWMRNTLVPLSVAFLQDDGTIVNIADMEPRSETEHCSNVPVRAALEMNRGWFTKRGIRPGMQIKGLPVRQ